MALDVNDFFRKATMQICGNLDIEAAMWGTLNYLQRYIPLTGLYLIFTEPGMSALQSVAQVNLHKVKKLIRFPFPPAKRAEIERGWADWKDVVIINNPEMYLVTRLVSRYMVLPDISIIFMRLKIPEKRYFSLVAYVDGRGQYTSEHGQLLSLLHEPFAMAMSNAFKHQEVLKLKEVMADDNQYLHQELLRISGNEIIGRKGGLKKVFEMVRQVAPLDSPVLLLGETGSGKEVIANAIHYSSSRKNGPFIKVNCGAIPETLIDSELFGHEKGAFTGAVSQKRGRFERAHKGTILLDEIGELPLNAQVRLLRLLQDKMVERVGGTKPVHVDIRIIAATHRDLKSMVLLKRFREDLLFRLHVFPINIPPLRERVNDIPDLVEYFIKRKSIEMNIYPPPAVVPGAIDLIKAYHWPGNVRELENVVERTLIQYHGQNISGPVETFEDAVFQKRGPKPLPLSAPEHEPSETDKLVFMHIKQALKMDNTQVLKLLELIDLLQGKNDTLMHLSRIIKRSFGKNIIPPVEQEAPHSQTNAQGTLNLDEVMASHIQTVLKITGGKVYGQGGAAELLGVNPATLRSRMQKMGLLHKKKDFFTH